jgi:hypothetical protein
MVVQTEDIRKINAFENLTELGVQEVVVLVSMQC